MSLFQLLSRSARLSPDAPAVAQGAAKPVAYRELASRALRLSGGLSGTLKLKRGDRVAIVAKNCAEYIELLFACWHAGLVAVPTNAKLHPKELDFIFANSGAAAVFATDGLAPDTGNAPRIEIGAKEYARLLSGDEAPAAEVAMTDPAWLFYTSGTTGLPKGATLTHRNLLFMTFAYFADIDTLGPGDSMLHAAPLSHGAGLYALPHVAAGSFNLIPESGGFEPDEIIDALARHTKVSFFAAPTMVTRLLAAPALGSANLANLKTIIYGGAPMYLADGLRSIEAFGGSKLFNLFGQGESPMTITGLPQSVHSDKAHPRFHERLASCGLPRSGIDVRVVDDDGRDVPPDEVGEIITRSDCVMRGYWENPEASARALKDGWLHTGDLGSLDADGFLTIRDRSKDMIISGGSNIYPREVEEVLLQDARVAECSVVGRPHADWGEEVIAFVVAKPGATIPTAELDSLCLDNIARFKRPKEYRFIDALPKNNYGKVLKTELRKKLES